MALPGGLALGGPEARTDGDTVGDGSPCAAQPTTTNSAVVTAMVQILVAWRRMAITREARPSIG